MPRESQTRVTKPRRNYAARRTDAVSRVFSIINGALVISTALMFAGLGNSMPLFAQITLVITAVWLLFRVFDALFPGVALPRGRVAQVGEDGIQGEKFLPWHEVETFSRKASDQTLKQRKAQQRENRRAAREKRSPRHIGRLTYFVLVRMKGGAGYAIHTAKSRTFLKDLDRTHARYLASQDDDEVPSAGYRTRAEASSDPFDVVLSPAEHRDVRVECFAELSAKQKSIVLECLADEDLLRVLEAD